MLPPPAAMDNPTEREYDRRLLEHDVLDLAQRVHLGELTEGERRELRYRILVRESQLTRVRTSQVRTAARRRATASAGRDTG